MSKLDQHITLADNGPIRVREKGFAVAAVPGLGRCSVENRGAKVRVEGGSGVADAYYQCAKDNADAYGWENIGATGAGLVLIDEDSFSGASSWSSGAVFTSTYRNYRILINIDSATASANLNMRMRVSGSDHSSGNYERGAVLRLTSGTTVTGINTAAGTEWPLIGLINGAVDGCISIDLMNPEVANKTGGFYESSYLSTATTVYTALSGGLGMRVTTQFDAFSLIASSGNITGNVHIYGYKEE